MALALKYFRDYSKTELIRLRQTIESTEENREPRGSNSLHFLKPAARKKVAAIDQAIAWHMADERKIAGRYRKTAIAADKQTVVNKEYWPWARWNSRSPWKE